MTMMSPERVRVTTRVPINVQNTLEVAAAIIGATVNQFIVQSALREAEHIIEQERVIRLSERDAEAFFQALSNPASPNTKLNTALKRYEDVRLDDQGTTFSWQPRPKRV
uniref:Uncharacterized conserved protein, DUF1778 family n=1 Tax=Candidatus Kentrum sp. LPFa TaxID=2126335 RepID=A0A450WQS5_9GAMM|nr:MAG: Uncharacterized conserved protein, DUF1778 family [Candidatus Kentron sp. LPFa]